MDEWTWTNGRFPEILLEWGKNENYNCFFSINEEELSTIVEPAHELVKVIAELISDK